MAFWLLQAAAEHNPLWEAVQGMAGGATVWWAFATAVHTMPEPSELNRWWYAWLYRFAQRVAANHDKANGLVGRSGRK